MSGLDPAIAAIDAEAAAWCVRMASDQVTLEDERAFAAWLAAAPEHRARYDAHAATWGGIGALREDPEALRALSSLRARAPERGGLSRRGLLAASVGGAFAVGAGWMAWRAMPAGQRFVTGVGEQRRIVLEDGSTVTLNTDSELRADLQAGERRLWLDRGQAFFSVAPDRARPFRVFVGADEVRALGTAFDVRREGGRARVTLEEGVVAVYRDASPETLRTEAPAAVLAPGQQLVVAEAALVPVGPVDVHRATAWRFGQMILDAEPLGEALAEINRYNARQIVLVDPSLAAMPVSGVFQTGRPEAFVDGLTTAFPVRVVSEDAGAIRLGAAS